MPVGRGCWVEGSESIISAFQAFSLTQVLLNLLPDRNKRAELQDGWVVFNYSFH